MNARFTDEFATYAIEGDRIDCDIGELTIRAEIHRDEFNTDPPDKQVDGFWPSKDPNDAGYCGDRDYAVELARAERVMDGWRRGEWWYVGLVLSAWIGDRCIEPHATSLWGIECNYPDAGNAYLLEAANELLPKAVEDVAATLAKLADDCRAALSSLAIAQQEGGDP